MAGKLRKYTIHLVTLSESDRTYVTHTLGTIAQLDAELERLKKQFPPAKSYKQLVSSRLSVDGYVNFEVNKISD